MIRVATIPARVDLRPFLQLLREHHLRAQVTEESGDQVLWTLSTGEAEQIAALLEAWRGGSLQPSQPAASAAAPGASSIKPLANGLLRAGYHAPVTLVMIALCGLVALFSNLGADPARVAWMFFPAYDMGGSRSLLLMLSQVGGVTEVLRMFTPALLHFGVLHLIFNTLWLWFLGRMIEGQQGSRRQLFLTLFTALLANLAQFLWTGQNNFGGMSGVVYGLIGYIWVWQSLNPRSSLRLPTAMIGIFLVALVLMELAASAWIATAAHVGGLLSGMLAAVLLQMMATATREERQ